MDSNIIMSQKEVKKYDVIKQLINRELNGTDAAEMLHLTVRQIRRLKQRVIENGIKGLTHGSRGKPGNRRLPETERRLIIQLLRKHYHDFGPTLAAEKLAERHKIYHHQKTIRSMMIVAELWQPRQKKIEQHRAWRQRKAHKGELIQYDGSYEYWFEDRGEKCCLLASIDDANGCVWAKFDNHEGVAPTFNYWREYVERFGKPNSIYVDRFSTYSMNHKLAKENPDTLTQFERATEELNIEIVHAHSPQAKGRVEKLFRTLQDRLIKELRLRHISTTEKANEFLEQEYLAKFNAKFMVEARSQTNLHKNLSNQEQAKLAAIFSRQDTRVVRNDFTINHKTNYYQLEKIQPVTICKQDKIIVEERMDGSIHLRLRGRYLNYSVLPEAPKKLNARESTMQWVIPKSRAHTPAANHPWRQAAILKTNKMSS